MHEITIDWEGPLKLGDVIRKEYDRGGKAPLWDGPDYGLYQIYGRHILDPKGASHYRSLLYIGEATKQTFTQRFREHKKSWLKHEWTESLSIHLGRFNGYKTTKAWRRDVLLAERILIYTFSPHYNSSSIANVPTLGGHEIVRIIHKNKENRGRLMNITVPKAWE